VQVHPVDARPRKLIETLAADIAAAVLEDPAASGVSVEVRKFILPGTRWVAVTFETRSDA